MLNLKGQFWYLPQRASLARVGSHMQTKVTDLNNYARNSGLKINSKKTEMLRINSKSNNNMIIAGQQLNEVDKYINLGAIINNQSGGGEDIDSLICKALGSFLTLKQIWNSNKLTLRTKLRLFQALVMSVLFLLYGCETWNINDCDKEIRHFPVQMSQKNSEGQVAMHYIK